MIGLDFKGLVVDGCMLLDFAAFYLCWLEADRFLLCGDDSLCVNVVIMMADGTMAV